MLVMPGAFKQLIEAVERELPGEHFAIQVIGSRGPVATRTKDGSYHVSFIEAHLDEQGDISGIEVIYQESFESEWRAAEEYFGFEHLLPPPPGAAQPISSVDEMLASKLNLQKAHRNSMIEHAEADREIFGEDLYRPR